MDAPEPKTIKGLFSKYPWSKLIQLRTPLSKITSTGEIEQRFRLN